MEYKRIFSALTALLTAAAALGQGIPVLAEEPAAAGYFRIGFDPIYCGTQITDGKLSDVDSIGSVVDEDFEPYEDSVRNEEILVQRVNDAGETVPFDGTILGGTDYQCVYTVTLSEQYRFTDETEWSVSNDTPCEVVEHDAHSAKIVFRQTAAHENDYSNNESVKATCLTEGRETFTCANCGKEIVEILPADPSRHVWGEWDFTDPPTAVKRGAAVRTCQECGETEQREVPMLYSTVYEPETSVSMAATVAWRADAGAMQAAGETVRPATVFVWVDADLKVYDRDGKLLADSVDGFVEQTAPSMIPAFYIRDAAAETALKAWLEETQFEDCFVVSTPENKALVKDAADLLHVRGMLDFTANKTPDRKALTDMIADVNGAHGKVVLLSAEAATRENVRLLQSLAATVWVQSPTDTKTIVTMYTNGVDGVLVDDYKAALHAEELFHDDAPTLLRTPFIIGHRGDPSNYPENTIESARGAFEEGADSIENDIHLSSDGEVFIRHDENMYNFYDMSDVEAADLTLAELKAIPFIWEKIRMQNEVACEDAAYGSRFGGKLYGEEEELEFFIPTFREFLEEFKGKDVVHDTEFKTTDPAIVPAFKALVDEYDAWDQVFTITFNENILETIYRDYPEISVGALMFFAPGSTGSVYDYFSYDTLEKESSPEIALERLYSHIDRWNATFNPMYGISSEPMVRAGRHRGLTVWPWTYSTSFDPQSVARDYLAGVRGMTVDEPWFASDLITQIASGDVQLETAEEMQTLAKPIGTTQAGQTRTLDTAEAVTLEQLGDNEMLMIWRYPAQLMIGEEDFGRYYLYSNPFVVSIGAKAAETTTPAAAVVETPMTQTTTPRPATGSVQTTSKRTYSTTAAVTTVKTGTDAANSAQPGTGDRLAGVLAGTGAILAVSGALALGTSRKLRRKKKDNE